MNWVKFMVVGWGCILLVYAASEYLICFESARSIHDCNGTTFNTNLCVEMNNSGAVLFKSCRFCKACWYNYTMYLPNATDENRYSLSDEGMSKIGVSGNEV